MDSHSSAIRPAVNAGRFYPADPAILRQTIAALLSRVPVCAAPPALPFGLIVPHAGYPYSGQTAAAGYVLLKNQPIRRVILIGASHYSRLSAPAVYEGTALATPLGEVAIDRHFVEQLADGLPLARISVATERQEHSLEVQLPFLQCVLEDFQVVPLLLHHHRHAQLKQLAEALSSLIQHEATSSTILIASSDLYHGYDEQEANRQDAHLENLLLQGNALGLLTEAQAGRCMACGISAIAAVLETASILGCNSIRVLARTNSSEVSHASGGYVVGYMAAMIS